MHPTHRFTLYLDGDDALEGENFDRLYDAGCHDALFGHARGRQVASFRRHAPTMSAAVAAAIGQIESAVPSLLVTEVRLGQPETKPRRIGERIAAGVTEIIAGGYSSRAVAAHKVTSYTKLQGLVTEVAPKHGYEVLELGVNKRLSQRAKKLSAPRSAATRQKLY
jgi:hypothetical protein